MSDLNDPRVLFAAERTLLAWNRTAAGLIALGFLIDRASLITAPGLDTQLGAWVGIAFLFLGVLLCVLSTVQYRRGVASLRPVEIPPHYWINLAVFTSLAVGALGALLGTYLIRSL
jgi:putative membrane protein